LAASKLTVLQQSILDVFFRTENQFFLTGGGALAGFYLGHRDTHDLDLFTLSDTLEEGTRLLAETARELGASIESIVTSPDFRRQLVRRESESVLVDLVRERVAQLAAKKPIIRGIRVDPPEEIFANKLCALLSRSEVRDLVDVRALEMAGYRLEDALPVAASKDGGVTPAQLGWVLNEIRLGDDLVVPGGIPVQELRGYLDNLVERLTRLAFPV
jgi:predicted nucleotidyltransferase component of viral defense system